MFARLAVGTDSKINCGTAAAQLSQGLMTKSHKVALVFPFLLLSSISCLTDIFITFILFFSLSFINVRQFFFKRST